ncbi:MULTISPECIES: signal recognition particle-docking protein FtsY [Methylotenera]|uniref:signal recognition particle-docking protein FtsY n=1 Tax=Methylotenera TaxID=359407 RepID=UPI000381A3FB|nr:MULTISPECIES: signal recognition particle-docking protein FtsY [Methylotenera]
MFNIFKKKPQPDSNDLKEQAVNQPNNEASFPAEIIPPSATPVIAQPTDVVPKEAEQKKVTEKIELSFTERLKQSLSKTRQQLGGQLNSLFGGGKIDAETYEELETILLTSDIGVAATQRLLDNLKKRVKRENLQDTTALKQALKIELLAVLTPLEIPLQTNLQKPFVIMLAGVNGAGKTTTIGKLAKLFQAQGKSVLIAAGDTFRAAAREQLQIWGERNNVHVIASEGGDAAAVIFDAVNSAIARKIDIVIADTAGRLPTQMHLMDEIKKVQRVIDKAYPGAPHEILLVIDSNTGQNAVSQVKAFDDALGVTGLVLSKLDGTAKGGVIAAIAEARPIPVRFIGIGEAIDDLRPFNAQAFVEALFD